MRKAAVVVAVLCALLLGGCGIPDDSNVRVLSTGPSTGPEFGNDDTQLEPPARDPLADKTTLVTDYLKAAAGDSVNAAARVRAFLAPTARSQFKPQTTDIEVIRLVDVPLSDPGAATVSVKVQQVGTLGGDDGQLVPNSDSAVTELTFDVGTVTGENGLFVLHAPSGLPAGLLLSDTALEQFYEPHTIYFWNNDNTGLVPDVRYMPTSVPTAQQPTVILGWLTAGPADWLKSANAVQALPQGTSVPDNIPATTNDSLEVNLSAQAVPPGDDKALDRLRQQLQWSLRSLLPDTLVLKIGHENPVSYSNAPMPDSNASAALSDAPDRFAIYNGVIRRFSESSHAVSPIPVLKGEANKNVQYAALSTSARHSFAAVVTGTGKSAALRVAVAPTGGQADLQVVKGLTGAKLGHPVWAVASAGDTADAIGLITADGRLYSFGPSAAAAKPVEWQSGDPGKVTEVSVAPDGVRVAVVAGGKLYRTVLTSSGDGIGLSTPLRITVPGLRSVTAAAWSAEGWFDAAGIRSTNGRYTLISVTIDGALTQSRVDDLGNQAVAYLSVYPANPLTRNPVSDSVCYDGASGKAWDVVGDPPTPINASDLAGPVGNTASGISPTAPFYLE
jgi:hypothetical protein